MRLDRIYTRGGDAGLTSLGDGTREARIAADKRAAPAGSAASAAPRETVS